jgi:3-hydroxybutyrate dehydrogenase
MTEEQVKKDVLLYAQPTKQFVTVEQVAGTAVFLCSDSAASITGGSINVEGGWVAH